jgi:hypothetical protein
MSICNDLTGLRWLRKSFTSHEKRDYLGLASWAGCIWFIVARSGKG